MKIPTKILEEIYAHYESQNRLFMQLDKQHKVINYEGSPQHFGLFDRLIDSSVKNLLPILSTETFEENFSIPYYNIQPDIICDIHYINDKQFSLLALIPRNLAHQETQKQQQRAHDENLERQRLIYLSRDLQLKQEELLKTNQQKTFMVSVLSHELATPLTSIIGYAELLQKNQINSIKGVDIILKNAKSLQNMIAQTINYGREEKNNTHRFNTFSVSHLFDQLQTIHQSAANKKKLQLSFFCLSESQVYHDMERIKQILINLISNAIKYTQKGAVDVRYTQHEKSICFTVTDTGQGMSKSFVKQLFKPWSRELKNDASGNGIGLTICHMLAQELNGSLELTYTGDTGSQFTLDLEYHTQRSTEKKCILIADDDPDIVTLIAHFLSEENYRIQTAHSIAELVDQSKKLEPDLILTDINYGSTQVTEIMDQLDQKKDNLIAMTAMPSIEKKHQLLNQGFREIITKPLDRNRLIHTISQILQQH